MSKYSKTNYDVASSARSESYFNEIKNILLCDNTTSLRVNKFIVKHIRSIIAACKIQRAAYNAALNKRQFLSENLNNSSEFSQHKKKKTGVDKIKKT